MTDISFNIEARNVAYMRKVLNWLGMRTNLSEELFSEQYSESCFEDILQPADTKCGHPRTFASLLHVNGYL